MSVCDPGCVCRAEFPPAIIRNLLQRTATSSIVESNIFHSTLFLRFDPQSSERRRPHSTGASSRRRTSHNERCSGRAKGGSEAIKFSKPNVSCARIHEVVHADAAFPRLYITNINDKIPKPDLRTALYSLFVTYGPILDVVALKTMKMRGQAHIVFRDVQTSTQAMRALQDFDFFGKKMVCAHRLRPQATVS